MTTIYSTPEKHLLTLHSVRPRFKNNIENVLFFMAKEISGFTTPIDNEKLNILISQFNENKVLKEKTLSNWRTEISTLFGLIQYQDEYGYYPSKITKRLSNKEDLIEFFKNITMKYQFPNGINKPHDTKTFIEKKVKFYPFKFVVDLLKELSKINKSDAYITKDELTYVIFDDLRFTTGEINHTDAKKIILKNRKENAEYQPHKYVKGKTKESKGDQTRTALDFLDYMELGNLLIKKSGCYFLNEIENDFINYAYNENGKFNFFDQFYKKDFTVRDLSKGKNQWFDYVNDLNFDKSSTSISKLIKTKTEEDTIKINDLPMTTKDIGDKGESIILSHEINKLKRLGLEHNQHLVKFIPTHLGVGYDIKSMDEIDNQMFIEVKTTLSKHPLTQTRISLTKNEWNAAYTHRENYYIYRLVINDESNKLFIINNPVEQVKNEKLKIIAPHGVDLAYKQDTFIESELYI